MPILRTDDFRVEHDGSAWIVTFTPTGMRFYFGPDGMETRESQSEVPARDMPTDYDPLEIERMAARIAYAARGRG